MNITKTKLRSFKLAGMVNSLEERITYANTQSLSHLQFLDLLCEDEENNRRDNSHKKRYARAKFSAHKLMEDFDFNFQPSIDQKQINDLSTCRYIGEKKNVIFTGSPGTGKTHLSIALGIKALAKNYRVAFTSASEMLYQLHISKADNSYYSKLNEYLFPHLLIIDELGFKKIPPYSAHDFFEIISKRYEKGSCIVTTNKTFEQWGDIFEDNSMSAALLDRLVHHSVLVNIKGHSYRAKDVKQTKQYSEAR